MCLAIPGKVISFNGDYALVNIMGVETEVFIKLIESPRMGDNVLVHIGCAIEKIEDEYYSFLTDQYNRILDEDGLKDG